MLLAILGMLLPVIPKVLVEWTKAKAEATNNALAIQAQEEIERRKLIRDIQVKETEHWIAWFPKFLLGMSVSIYASSIFLVSTFGLPWVVLEVPSEMNWVLTVVVGGWFLESSVKRLKR